MTLLYQIRDELKRAVVANPLGPVGGPDEIVAERYVRGRYLGCTTIQGRNM